MLKGVMYISWGQRSILETIYSAKTLKKTSPDVGTCIFTNVNVDSRWFDDIRIVKFPSGEKRFKFDYLNKSPYDYTLYLDGDTCIKRDISDVFSILNRFDVALTHDFGRKQKIWTKKIPEYADIPYGFPEFNGGVLLYKKNEITYNFIKLWKELYKKFIHKYKVPYDQISLRVSLWQSCVSIHTLPPEYNLRSKNQRKKWRKRIEKKIEYPDLLKPRILHNHQLNNNKIKFSPFCY